jgi:zinc protease
MPLDPVRRVLSNGIVVVAQTNTTTPAVSILAALRAGGYDDADGREGTAALLARVLDRGTTTRTADVIADDLDGRGASLSVSAGRHHVTVAATCLATDIAPVMTVVADVIVSPVFPDTDVATRKAELITGIRQEEDDPASVAVDRLMREVYAGHPYARRVRGTVTSVEALGRDDLERLHRSRFAPGALTLVLVGSLSADALMGLAEEAFGGWTATVVPTLAVVPEGPAARSRRDIRVPMPDKSQSDVAYGFAGLRRSDPQCLAATVMNHALGQYALGGRLGDSIRERQGMAYYVFSSIDAGLGPGPLMIRAGVAAANVERTIASIDAELEAIRGEDLSPGEVADSIRYMVGALPRRLETNAGIASFLLDAELHGLGLDYDRRLPGLLRAVTRDDAIAAARRLLDPSYATIVTAGPEAVA